MIQMRDFCGDGLCIVVRQSIRSWVAQVDRNEGRREDGLASDERQARTRLPRENRLKQARESLGFSRRAGIVQETGSIPFKGACA